MATREKFLPVSLCRILLALEYNGTPKSITNEMMRNPHMIPDPLFGLNVMNCWFNDKSDGPLIDLKRQAIGEDYEVRLKKLAADVGLEFHDEVYLRRYGYDKTPDLKLAVPCMYKGKIISWIESKASFGDMTSHRQYVNDQLASYGNRYVNWHCKWFEFLEENGIHSLRHLYEFDICRFGCGVVIYWFGYLDQVAMCPENKDCIIVTDEFPKKEDIILMNLPHNWYDRSWRRSFVVFVSLDDL